MSEEVHVHGVDYIRTGQCNRCGECEKETCPHFSMVDGLATCSVHETKGEDCEYCSTHKDSYFYNPKRRANHQVCKDFPTHPFLRVIKEGLCGFKFEPATAEDKVKHKKLVKAWQ